MESMKQSISSSDQVFNNPYIVNRIVRELDIRSLFSAHYLSKEFFDASAEEYEKRKDIIHLYLLNYEQNSREETKRLYLSFRQFCEVWLNIRPKHVLVLIGGYQKSIDYRQQKSGLQYMTEYLPKECRITFLDVGHSVLTSSIRFKSLTNYSTNQNNDLQDFQRTSFPCMSCVFIPEMEGIEVRSYDTIEDVVTEDLKCVLFFESTKMRDRRPKDRIRDLQTMAAIHTLIARLEYNVSFGGGTVKVAKTMQKSSPKDEDCIRTHVILTFGGHRIRSSSTVMPTMHLNNFLGHLMHFRDNLSFDCNDWLNSMTIAFVFANRRNFTIQFTTDFQTVFPFVGLFGFQSNDKMFGQNFLNANSDRNLFHENIDPQRHCVIVLVNFMFRKCSSGSKSASNH